MPSTIIRDIFKNKLKDYLNYIIVLVSVLLFASLIRNALQIKKANEKILETEVEVEKLRVENKELEAQLKKVQSDYFVEKQLRDKLGLAKEGEIVVVLPEEEVLKKLAPVYQTEEEVLPDPNWKKWAKLFGL